jgi:hypothetical protein
VESELSARASSAGYSELPEDREAYHGV